MCDISSEIWTLCRSPRRLFVTCGPSEHIQPHSPTDRRRERRAASCHAADRIWTAGGAEEAEKDGGEQANKQFYAGGKTHYGRGRERQWRETVNEPQFSIFTTYFNHRRRRQRHVTTETFSRTRLKGLLDMFIGR